MSYLEARLSLEVSLFSLCSGPAHASLMSSLTEDEPVSIIAYTLSSLEYRRELLKCKHLSSTPRSEEPAFDLPLTASSRRNSRSVSAEFSSSLVDVLPESYDDWSVETSRSETPRDLSASFLSLRGGLGRKKSDANLSIAGLSAAPTPKTKMPALTSVFAEPELASGTLSRGKSAGLQSV